jgi:DNA-binding MarR family transcriptional regulator
MHARRPAPESDDSGVVLGILATVGREEQVTQRTLAAELGIALGLINAYVKRCVKKGLIKVKRVPPRRFTYYLTPHGLTEKSRLTAQYLSRSFDFFRRARRDCENTLRIAAAKGFSHIVLVGAGDLAEIAVICAVESSVSIVGIVDPKVERSTLLGLPVFPDLESVDLSVDAAMITATEDPADAWAAAARKMGSGRILAPALLHALLSHQPEAGKPRHDSE